EQHRAGTLDARRPIAVGGEHTRDRTDADREYPDQDQTQPERGYRPQHDREAGTDTVGNLATVPRVQRSEPGSEGRGEHGSGTDKNHCRGQPGGDHFRDRDPVLVGYAEVAMHQLASVSHELDWQRSAEAELRA